MANSVIGALRVNLGLDSAKFESGARRVKKPLQQMKAQFRAVAGVAVALGAALSAFALKGAKDIDETAKSARRLDASIAGFLALEVAASEAGVSLSGLTNDIQTMNREIASIGTSGNGQRALDALGLSIDDLEGKDADEKLAIIADQVSALGLNAGETTAILRDLGVRNREMALLVLQGGKSIREARSDIENYGLAVSEVDADRIEVANDAIGRLGLITQYAGQQLAIALVPALGAMAQAMTDSLREGGLLRTMIDALVGNIDLLINTVGVAVVGFGVRYVGALVLAKVATFSLSGALVALRGALLATGIGALIVGAGLAVTYFTRLVSSAGGLGEALGLLGDVAREVWDRIKLGFVGLEFALAAGWMKTKAVALEAFGGIAEAALNTVNKIVGGYVGAYNAVVAAWGALPSAFSRIGAMAINLLIDAIGSGIGGVLSPINSILEKLGGTPIAPPDLSGWKVTVGDAESVAGKAKAAFDAAFATDYVNASGIAEGINSQVSDLRDAGAAATKFGKMFTDAARAPLSSLAALKQAVTGTKVEADGAASAVGDLASALEEAGGSGGGGGAAGAVSSMNEKVSELGGSAANMKETFKGAFKDILKGAKSFGDVVKGVLGGIADKFIDMGVNGLADAIFGGGAAGGGGLLGAIFGGGNSGGGFFSNLFGGFRATGGPVQSGKVYAVNENTKNTEYFAPGVSGTILRNDQVSIGGGASGGQQHTHVTVGVDTDSSGNLMPFVKSVVDQSNSQRDNSFAGRSNAVRESVHPRRR